MGIRLSLDSVVLSSAHRRSIFCSTLILDASREVLAVSKHDSVGLCNVSIREGESGIGLLLLL
jgi:hypothetical protein